MTAALIVWAVTVIFRSFPQAATAVYTGGIYPVIRYGADLILRFVPFSLMGLFVMVVGAILLREAVKRQWRNLVNIAGWLYAAFYLLWGFNYFSETIDRTAGLDVEPVDEITRDNLLQTTLELTVRLSGLAGNIEDADKDALMEKITSGCAKTCAEFPLLTVLHSDPVPMVPQAFFLRLGITGMYFPYTMQPQYEPLLRNIGMPFTAAHEYFHAAGSAPETEANFLAWLSLYRTDDPRLQYSAGMNLLIELLGYYKRNDPEKYMVFRQRFTEKMNLDLAYKQALYRRFANPVSKRSGMVIDRYLKMQNQTGMVDYRRLADWVAAWMKKEE